MKLFLSLTLLALLCVAHPAMGQQVHRVRLVASAGGDAYEFRPDQVTVRAGEVVEFVVESGGPYVVAFEPADLDPRGRELVALALGAPRDALRGPILEREGSRFRLTVPPLRAGRYRFTCLTHLAYRMAGTLIVR